MTNYRRGRAMEYRVMQRLGEEGYICTRNAGSHGMWDVTGVGTHDVVLVQVKLGKTEPRSVPASCRDFEAMLVPDGVRKYVYIFKKGMTNPYVFPV